MDNTAKITKMTKVEIPYDSTTLVDFSIAMSPSSLVITIVNKEEKKSTSVNKKDEPAKSSKKKDNVVPIKQEDIPKPKITIRAAVAAALKANNSWIDYESLATEASEILGAPLTREQVRDTCKKFRSQGFIDTMNSTVDKRTIVKWVSKQ